MANCGPSDRLTLTVAPLAGPPPGRNWRFHYAAGGQPIAVRNVSSAGNALAYLFSDHLGSTRVAADPNGTLVARQSYYPYGAVRTSSGSLPTERTFTGQVSDVDSTGLLFFNARYYDGALGRFVSADSIVPAPSNPQSLNRYSFVLNNPIKYTDPTGHRPCEGLDENDQCITPSGWGKGTRPDPATLYSEYDPTPLIDYTQSTEYGDNALEYVGFYIYYRDHLPAEWGPGPFTIEEFLGLMILYERYGAVDLTDYLVEAVTRQLWTGTDFTRNNYAGPYCTASPCFNGVLNFLARYSQSAHGRFDQYKAGTLVITLPGEQGAPYNDITASNVRQMARDLGHRMLNPPPGLTWDLSRPFHFGNWYGVAPPIYFGEPFGNFYITPP